MATAGIDYGVFADGALNTAVRIAGIVQPDGTATNSGNFHVQSVIDPHWQTQLSNPANLVQGTPFVAPGGHVQVTLSGPGRGYVTVDETTGEINGIELISTTDATKGCGEGDGRRAWRRKLDCWRGR